LEEILALLVAFWEAVRPERRAKFSRVRVIKCDDFQFFRELIEKSIKCVQEAEVPFVIACLCAWMVGGGKSQGELFFAMLPLHLFTNLVVACQYDIDAYELSHKFFSCVGCDGWSSSRGFPPFVVTWQ
jgi:hypothetical protein